MSSHLPLESAKSFATEHIQKVRDSLRSLDVDHIGRVFEILRSARDRDSMVYVAGNGGSAATASHWVNDMGKATKRSGRPPFRIISLGDNVPWLTALGNDEGYDKIFSGQLENFVRPGDVLLVISASGNSTNLIKAVELARDNEAVTIGLLGFDGGLLKDLVDEYICLDTEIGAYELVEDCHMSVCHILTICLTGDACRNDIED